MSTKRSIHGTARRLSMAVVAVGLCILGPQTSRADSADSADASNAAGVTRADEHASATVSECQGCKHTAEAVHVIDVQSTYYTAKHIDDVFSGKLRRCYEKAGWRAPEEKQLEYLVAYDAEKGRVTSVKGAMFGPSANHDLLACIDRKLTGVKIGKVRKDREVHGFSMTVRVKP